MSDEPDSLCERCAYYIRAISATREGQGDSAECAEPRHGHLRTQTMRRWPVMQCMGFAARAAIARAKGVQS